MTTNEKSADSKNGERELSIDRLIRIDGIATKTAEAMYEIGVRSYIDLAQYLSQHTAAEVSAALKEHGLKRPTALIDTAMWARQARAFGQVEDAASTLPEEGTELAKELKETPPSRDSQDHDAVFTISFDIARGGDHEPVLHTTVCDRTNGGGEGIFQGSEAAPWVNWILERACLPVTVERIATQAELLRVQPQIKTEIATSPIPIEPDDTRLEIGDVQLAVIGPTSSVPEKKLEAEINFELSGTGAETLASKGIPFRVEGYTVDIESGVSELVASDRGQLTPHVLEYRHQQQFGIPDVGRYEFHSIVLLLPPGKMGVYHRGPTIRVVP